MSSLPQSRRTFLQRLAALTSASAIGRARAAQEPTPGTSYYVDGGTGSDSDAGSANEPFATLGMAMRTARPGDTIRVRGGTTYAEQVAVSTDNLTIEAYGTGIWRVTGSKERDYGIVSQGFGGLSISDCEILDCRVNGLLIGNDNPNSTKRKFRLSRLFVHDIGPAPITPASEAELGAGTAVLIRTGPTTGTAVIEDVLLDAVRTSNAGKIGIDCRWRVLNAVFRDCESSTNGVSPVSGGHGFSLHPMLAELRAGWVLEGGTIYSHERVSESDNEQRMSNATRGGSASLLLKSDSSPAKLRPGEWCVDSTKLYVNIDADPNAAVLIVKRHQHGPFIYTSCTAQRNMTGAITAEGHGFSADDLSGPVLWDRCLSEQNEGDGYIVNDGENCTVRASLSLRNQGNGIDFPRATGVRIYHSVVAWNGGRGIYDGGTHALDTELRNNIAYGNGNPNVRRNGIALTSDTAATLRQGGNYAFANSAASQVENAFAIQEDPLFADAASGDFRLQQESPCIHSGEPGFAELDFAGMQFAPIPSIGAFEHDSR